MTNNEKILLVLETIKDKAGLLPNGIIIEYRAGRESNSFNIEDEISILNKLDSEGIINVVDNFGSESI